MEKQDENFSIENYPYEIIHSDADGASVKFKTWEEARKQWVEITVPKINPRIILLLS